MNRAPDILRTIEAFRRDRAEGASRRVLKEYLAELVTYLDLDAAPGRHEITPWLEQETPETTARLNRVLDDLERRMRNGDTG